MAKELVDKIMILEFKQELKGYLNNVMETLDEAKEEIIRLVKENKELKAQIEKMKCCANCKKYWRMCEYGDREMQICEKWEIKEND